VYDAGLGQRRRLTRALQVRRRTMRSPARVSRHWSAC